MPWGTLGEGVPRKSGRKEILLERTIVKESTLKKKKKRKLSRREHLR